jgi:hypothetical protein
MRLHIVALAGAITLVAVLEASAFGRSYRPMVHPMGYRTFSPTYGAPMISPANFARYNASANYSANLYRQYYQAYLMSRAAEIRAQQQNGGGFIGPFIGPPNPLSVGNPPIYIPPAPYGRSMYPIPPQFQYLPIGAVIRGPRMPGAVFDLQVAAFQGRKVFTPVTGGNGGDGSGD